MKDLKKPDFSQVPGDFRYHVELDEQGLITPIEQVFY